MLYSVNSDENESSIKYNDGEGDQAKVNKRSEGKKIIMMHRVNEKDDT